MGCASSKPDDDVGGQEIGGGGGGGAKDDKGRLSFLNSSEGNNEQFQARHREVELISCAAPLSATAGRSPPHGL